MSRAALPGPVGEKNALGPGAARRLRRDRPTFRWRSFGLAFAVHSRIDATVAQVTELVHAGNL